MTQPIFALRGNSLNAIYAPQDEKPFYPVKNESNPTLVSNSGLTGTFGSNLIDVSNPSNAGYRGIGYTGNLNVNLQSGALSAIIRIVPLFNGFPANDICLFSTASAAASQTSEFELDWLANGTFLFSMYLANGNLAVSTTTSQTFSGVQNTAVDIQLSWDGTTSSGINISINGVLLGNMAASHIFECIPSQIASIMLGTGNVKVYNDFYVDEFLIFDAAMPTTYTRSAYWPTSILQPLSSTDPGVSNVLSGVSYNFQGNSESGTSLSTDPGQANVLNGVSYEINSVSKTGTSLSTDPGQGNVLNGTSYEINSVSKTGTLVSTDPGQANVLNGVSYEINSVNKTGTSLTTDPGQANVLNGVSYEINSVAKTGTLTSTDPGVSNVIEGVHYEINNVPLVGSHPSGYTDPGIGNVLKGVSYEFADATLTGTLEQAFNTLTQATLTPQGLHAFTKLAFTQGDTTTFMLQAQDGAGNPINLTGSTFSTQVLGPQGVVNSFGNSQHTIIDAINGIFELALSSTDTNACAVGSNREIVSHITQGSTTIAYRGVGILDVLFPTPTH